MRPINIAVGLLLCAIAFSRSAHADSITLTLNQADMTGIAGQTLTYNATVSALASNSGDVYLSSLSFTNDSQLSVDQTDFLTNFPFFLSPGESFTGDLFEVILADNITPGSSLAGVVFLQGGADISSQDILDSQNFSVNVPLSVVPEPSSVVLVTTGVAVLAFILRGRRKCLFELHAVDG